MRDVRVLVADDDRALRTTTVAILRIAGFEVSEAEHGDEVLERLAEAPVDVLVLDVRMPGRDGIAVVEEMRPRPPPPAVLMVSAYALDQEVRDRLGSRVRRYLRKPVRPEHLVSEVEEAAGLAS
ncbi:MAG TPA: response regulator [Acidimicrobiales bacterium]|nr:response regulator [Acidimicrobiales bacterium]